MSSKQATTLREAIEELEDEILLARRGKSEYTPERLAKIIVRKEDELKVVDDEIRAIEEAASVQRLEAADIAALRKALPKWDALFEQADTDSKKMMLSSIIKSVIVGHNSIEVRVNLHIRQFLGIADGATFGMHSPLTWESA